MAFCLELKNLYVKAGNAILLKDISADFFAGKINTIIGPNGAGKTTLFNAISGLIPIYNGKILFNGQEIQNLPHYKRANLGIGRLFQDIKIFGQMTVFENVLSACFKREEENPIYPFLFRRKLKESLKKYEIKVDKLLELVELSNLKNKKAEELSFGQQKLLAIARLLAGEFKVLLLDEPTAGLNPIMRNKVLEILKILKKENKVIILIEHDMEFVSSISDWIYFMHEGSISHFGEPKYILSHEEIRDIYIGASSWKSFPIVAEFLCSFLI